MRGKGINYDVGFMPGKSSRPDFDPAVVAAEMRVIARELGCTAVRISGADPERIDVAARAAAAEGLEIWFSPFPVEEPAASMLSLFRDCADRAERLRRDGATVVLVIGCELTLFNPGYFPGTLFYDRIRRLAQPGPRHLAAFARMPKRLNAFLAEAADAARGTFGGPLTYASGTWEPVDWSRFDIVGLDAYRDDRNADSFRADLRARTAHGKPVAATEFGCCPYAGAAARGGLGWDIAEDDENGVPFIKGEYQRDESEQVRYMQELNQIFVEEGLDLAFWFTFAGYDMPSSPDPHRDADLASYGLVSLLPNGPGGGYQSLGWRPRLAFETMAALPCAATDDQNQY
ncbi:MAG TPA: hypothetical protein VK817_17990 [Trebonia sp.]|jgi:hypothetical protein|nr:hypothetical protein [Trebonia sp.]